MTIHHDLDAKALSLFELSLEQPSESRKAWLIDRTQDDLPLQNRVLKFLDVDDGDASALHTGAAMSDHFVDERPPEKIGAYSIGPLIGQGGMGAVYKATRIAGDFDHSVAVKLIKAGILSDNLKERFNQERQLLAKFSHPNIARLYDGGTTKTGSPYIIMELVDGIAITDWAEEKSLDKDDRLQLFLTTCEAVSYAHQNLIVHRDLTPSNVLVDTAGSVKLIDFGIAKPHAADADAAAVAPSLTSLSFTPGYAAPERSIGAAANTLSDIYSLGKLLETLLKDNLTDDIQAIISKATAPLPEDRYSAARTLIEDIERYLEGFAVKSRNGGLLYRAGKFITRHKLAVLACSFALAGLVAALMITTSLYHQAQNSRADAERRYSETQTIANSMMFDVFDEVSKVPGSTKARSVLAKTAQDYLDSLASDASATTDTRLSAGIGYYRLAKTTGSQEQSLGQFASSKANYERSKTLLERLHLEDPEREDVRIAYAQTLSSLAGALLNIDGDFKQARSLAKQSRDLLSDLNSVTPETTNILGTAYYYEGDSYLWERNFEKARSILDEGIKKINETQPDIQNSLLAKQALGILWTALGNAYGTEGNMPDAIAALEAAATLKRDAVTLSGNAPADIRNHVITLLSLAKAQGFSGQLQDGLQNIQEAHALASDAVKRDPEDLGSKELLVAIKNLYGGILALLNRPEGSESMIDEAVEIGREVSQKNKDVARGPMAFAVRLSEAAGTYFAIGRKQKACALIDESISIIEKFQETGELSEIDKTNALNPLLKARELC